MDSDTQARHRGPDELLGSIRTVAPSLPDAMGRVTRVILDDPVAASRSTISELAGSASTSEGTVTRTVRALGFHSYSDFRLTLAGLAGRHGHTPTVTGDVTPDDPIETLVRKVGATETQFIAETVAHLDADALSRAAEAVAEAEAVSLYGAVSSGLATTDLHIRLVRIGIRATSSVDPHLAIAEAALLSERDVAIVSSHSGTSRDALEFLAAAQGAGATTIAITGEVRTPLARRADHTLIALGEDDAFRMGRVASRISGMFVAHCLFVAVTQLTSDRAAEALERSYVPLSRRLSGPR